MDITSIKAVGFDLDGTLVNSRTALALTFLDVLKKWGLTDNEINERFNWFIEALSYGTPPHAGIALGLDRLISTMLNLSSIRDAIPFPETQTGYEPLSDAPAHIDQSILDEYNLSIKEEME